MKLQWGLASTSRAWGRSREGAWIEIPAWESERGYNQRRSREGAWIEILICNDLYWRWNSRSREGAWIEIASYFLAELLAKVAPARERGLKFIDLSDIPQKAGRSREGAWIEIPLLLFAPAHILRRSREGAWIEIFVPTFALPP